MDVLHVVLVRDAQRGIEGPRVRAGILPMIDYIVLGSTVDDFTRGFAGQPGTYAETYPALARALDQTDRDAINDDAFETCLRLVLTELGTELSRREHDQIDAVPTGRSTFRPDHARTASSTAGQA